MTEAFLTTEIDFLTIAVTRTSREEFSNYVHKPAEDVFSEGIKTILYQNRKKYPRVHPEFSLELLEPLFLLSCQFKDGPAGQDASPS